MSYCMEQGGVVGVSNNAPPDVEGEYQVAGEVVASDSWPVGSTISSTMCLYEQTGDGTIGVREVAETAESEAEQAWIAGNSYKLSVYMELLREDSCLGGCVYQSLAVLSGSVDNDGDITMHTALVSVAVDGCPSSYNDDLGSCWATSATASLTGTCEGG